MATKELFTRIALRYDQLSTWETTNPELLRGELAVAYLGDTQTTTTPDNGTHPVLFKVGPGKFNDLPFASALAADVYGWAKASDVKLVETTNDKGEVTARTLTFVGGGANGTDKIVALNFITKSEVEALIAPVSARVKAIEDSIGAGGNVAGQIAELTGKVNAISGDGDGSFKKADLAVAAAAEADATAKANAAEAAAKSDANAKFVEDRARLDAIEAKNTAQDGLISGNAGAITAEENARKQAITDLGNELRAADTKINNKLEGITDSEKVKDLIDAAKTEGTEAKNAVENLKKNEVAENTRKIGVNEAAIDALEDKVDAEIERSTDIDNDHEERIAAMEVFWKSADNSTEVVDTLKEIQDCIASDESGAATMAGNIQANTEDITEIKTSLADGGDTAKKIAKNASDIIAVADRATALETLTAGFDGTTISAEIERVEGIATNAQTKAGTVEGKVTTAEGKITALEGKATTFESDISGLKTRVTTAEGAIDALEDRMDDAEGAISGLKGIVETGADANDKLRAAITDLQTLTGGANGNDNLRDAIDALDDKVNATDGTSLADTYTLAKGADGKAETNAANIKAIADDYVKASEFLADEYIFNCGNAAGKGSSLITA